MHVSNNDCTYTFIFRFITQRSNDRLTWTNLHNYVNMRVSNAENLSMALVNLSTDKYNKLRFLFDGTDISNMDIIDMN
jgi:hypothetical protein